jgi:hypothetical protein
MFVEHVWKSIVVRPLTIANCRSIHLQDQGIFHRTLPNLLARPSNSCARSCHDETGENLHLLTPSVI